MILQRANGREPEKAQGSEDQVREAYYERKGLGSALWYSILPTSRDMALGFEYPRISRSSQLISAGADICMDWRGCESGLQREGH